MTYNDQRIDHGNSPCKGLSIQLSFCSKELKRIIVVNSLGLTPNLRESLEKLGKIGRYSPEIIADALVSLMEEKNGKTNNNKDTGRPLK